MSKKSGRKIIRRDVGRAKKQIIGKITPKGKPTRIRIKREKK